MKDLLRNNLPEILSITATLIGYVLLLTGLYTLFRHEAVWWLGSGLILVGAFGWRLLYELLADGVYGTWAAGQEEDES